MIDIFLDYTHDLLDPLLDMIKLDKLLVENILFDSIVNLFQ